MKERIFTTYEEPLKGRTFTEKQMQTVKRFTKADNGKLSKVLQYESGARVEIPINKDGSVRWFDDRKLLKASTK